MLKQIFGSKVGNVSAADASYQDYLNKNTYCELKQVVGKMQYENWTFEQKQKLHDLYDKRVIMKTREADLANIRLDKDKELHPENYPGLFKLIAYGPPDYDGMSTRDYVKQMQEFYNYYKSIDNCVIDNDYLHWINSEKIRLNNL